MKERLEIKINNLLDEKLELRNEIQKISWGMKYASLMTPNANERKNQLVEKLKQVQKEIDMLNWILEGDE